MVLEINNDEREQKMNYIKRREAFGKYLNAKERRCMYMYVIYVKQQNRRKKRKIPHTDIHELHQQYCLLFSVHERCCEH